MFQITFKQKLILVVLVALFGFGGLGITTFYALATQSTLAEAKDRIARIVDTTMTTQMSVLMMANSKKGLSSDSLQIAVATEELSTTIQDMALNMDQIAQNVGANSSATDKIAAAATDVLGRSETLQGLTTEFRTA